jgi:hypothetical protein
MDTIIRPTSTQDTQHHSDHDGDNQQSALQQARNICDALTCIGADTINVWGFKRKLIFLTRF